MTYSFFKTPESILKTFRVRLRTLVTYNLIPAAVLGLGLSLLMFMAGGVENPLEYVLVTGSIVMLSVFFSVHNLTLYYLLQPYDVSTDMKSHSYTMASTITYFICLILSQQKIPLTVYCGVCIAGTAVYFVAACVLVYRLAPRTFRLRT